MKNRFEEMLIPIADLPKGWQGLSARDDLEEFLQLNWNHRSVFYDDSEFNYNSKQQFVEFRKSGIRTNGYIGTIIFKGQQLNIFPKIFKEEKDNFSTDKLLIEHLMHNIGIWVDYSNKFQFPFLSISSDFKDSTDLLDLFISLYVRYVKRIVDRELYHRYEDVTESISVAKGKSNIDDYITKKIPTGRNDKIECTYSSFEFDNPLNRIIKCTCKYLNRLAKAANQKFIGQILFKLSEVTDVNCTPSDCDAIKLSRLHSYYEIIVSMSKMFLLNKSISYSSDDVDAFCFLFPTALLYEGFIGGILQEVLEKKGIVRLQASDKYLVEEARLGRTSFGKAFRMQNDYLVEMKNGAAYILDAKYKEIDCLTEEGMQRIILGKQIGQDDLYQMNAYIGSRGLKKAHLLYPMFRYDDDEANPLEMMGKVNYEGKEYDIAFMAHRLPVVFEIGDDTNMKRLKSAIEKIFDLEEKL